MPRREDIKRVNVRLDRKLEESLYDKIKSRAFSAEARIAVKKLTDLYRMSPSKLKEEMFRLRSDIVGIKKSDDFKRLVVEFPKEDVVKLNEATKYLHENGIEVRQNELIYGALLRHIKR